jgi:flagellar biosynthesis protein FlhG
MAPTLRERAVGAAGPVIAIASGKGGVGKTWFAITLAHAFARRGERVLLFDGDLGLANVDIQLGLMPASDLAAWASRGASLAELVTPAGEFDVLAGRSGSGALASLPRDQLERLGHDLRGLAGGYGRVILDLGAGLEGPVPLLAQRADTLLVVTTDEPTALTDAYAFVKTTLARRPGADLRIVVNFAASPRDGERTYATLERACRQFLRVAPPLAGIVRRDAKVRDAIRSQQPLLTRHPAADAATDVETLARLLAGEGRDARR